MRNGNLHNAPQSPCTRQNLFQNECELSKGELIARVLHEENQDNEEKQRGLLMPQSPQKKARVERLGRTSNACKRKKGGQSRHKSSCLATDVSGDATFMASTVSDNVIKRHSKDMVTSCQGDSLLVHASTVTTLSPQCLQRKYMDSSVSSQPIVSQTATDESLNDLKLSPIKTEPMAMSPGHSHDQPDSSTSAYEQAGREDVPQHNVPSSAMTDVKVSPCLSATTSYSKTEVTLCQVCGDLAAGFYCRAYICEACKKFFIRASKLGQPKYTCLRSKHCAITKESRVHCQYCRYQKCLQLNMTYPKDRQINVMKIGVQEIPCRVCSAPSSGFHFGALTCEGCKGFFRRMVKEREAYSYKCSRNGNCEIKAMTRNMCKACRYNKCLQIGMSVKGSRIGRQPNAVKHALSLEARKQAALKVYPGNDNEGNTDSSPSEISFDSVIIDHCIPRDMEDCLQSIDLIQVSSSGDVFRQPLRKDEEVKPDMSLMHCQYDRMLNGEQNQDLFEGHVDHHSHIARHQMPTVSSGDNQMSSRDNHMPIVSSRDNHMPIVSSRGNHMPIVSSRDNSMPSVSFRDNHMPSVSSRDNHVPIVSSRDNHVPIVSSRDNHMPIASSRDNHTPIVSYRDNHTPIVSSRDNMSTVSSGHLHSGVQISYTSSLNQTSTSATIQRKFEPQIFGRPHIEVFDSSSDNQPQNLSIDLSKPRTLNTNDCGHNSSQNILPAADQFSLSSECSSTCVPPHGHTNLPSPSTGSPSSTYNYPIDYTHHVQQNDQCSYPIHNFVGQDEYYRPAYQHLERYEGSSPVFNMDSQIPNHNGEHSVLQMSQQEAFVSRMFTQSAEFQSLGGQFSSQFSRPDILPYIFPDQQQTSFPPRYRSEPFYNSEPIPSRQSSMDEAQPQSNGHTEESTHHVERGDTYKIHSDLRNFHTRSCPTAERQNFVGSQQMSNFHTNTSHIHAGTMPQPPCYPQLHSSLYDTESTVSQCSYKDQGLIQRSPQNNDNQEPPTSTPVNHDAGINNYLAMSNKELHGVLLDAAGNLANFCTVKRAKSDVFEEARFRDVDSTWEKMMEHFNFHARCIVRFAKRVPGFRSLKIDDQVLLLKMATYSLVILNHSRAYEPDTGFYNYFNFTKREIEMIRELFPEFDVIHIHYKHMGIMAQRDGLTEMEYAYLSCMLLFNDEYSGLENAERTKELKERYLEAFHNYEMEHFPSGSIRFGKMLQHMTEFSQFNMQHNIAVGLVITKNPQLHIPQLYAEMYTPDYPAEGKADSVNDNITDVVDKFVEPPAVVGTDK